MIIEKLWSILLAALGACILAGLIAITGGWWTPWAGRYVQGVDVSHHQGAIDWRALASDNVAFAYIKATEGATLVDDHFQVNWNGAGAVGLRRGAYHYFTMCRPGGEQAQNFIRVAPRDPNALPPALDLEHMGPCERTPPVADVAAEVRAFLDAAEAYYGVRPILYTTREFNDAHLREFRGERFWVRSIGQRPRFRGHEWIFWQHHNRGLRAGISGPVDLDAFRGDAEALAAFASKEAQ